MLRFAQEWETMSGVDLYYLGREPDIEWDPRIVDRLIEVGDGWYLYRAGRDWPDHRYNSRIMDSLIEVGDGGDLYWAGREWPNDRYDPRILDRFLEVGDGWDLYYAGRDWSDDRYAPGIAQALIDTKDMRWIRAALGEEEDYKPWSPERIRDMLMAWQGIGEDDA